MSEDWLEVDRRATDRASRYAPLPKEEPVHAGIAGAAIVGVVLAVFLGLAGLNQEAFAPTIGLTVVIGYFVPYLYLKLKANRHYAAVVKEHAAIEREMAAPALGREGEGEAD